MDAIIVRFDGDDKQRIAIEGISANRATKVVDELLLFFVVRDGFSLCSQNLLPERDRLCC
jgi:hypothetical protein